MLKTNVDSLELKDVFKDSTPICDAIKFIMPSGTALQLTEDNAFELVSTVFGDAQLHKGDSFYKSAIMKLSDADEDLKKLIPTVYMCEVLSHVYCVDEMHDKLLNVITVDSLDDYISKVYEFHDIYKGIPCVQDFNSLVQVRLHYTFIDSLFNHGHCVQLFDSKGNTCALVGIVYGCIFLMQHHESGAYVLTSMSVPMNLLQFDGSSGIGNEVTLMLLRGLLAYSDIIIENNKFLAPVNKEFDSITEEPTDCVLHKCFSETDLSSVLTMLNYVKVRTERLMV